MLELNGGLRIAQVLVLFVFAALVVWLALGVGLAALVIWALVHLVTTRTSSPRLEHHRLSTRDDARERGQAGEETNIVALVAAGCAVVAGVPVVLAQATWWSAWIAIAAVVFAAIVLASRRQTSTGTRNAMVGALVMSVLVAFMGVFGFWVDRPTTLYGEETGSRSGTFTTIEEYQALLPCLDQPASPASSEQELFSLRTSAFVATTSCKISSDEDALPVVFVRAASAAELGEVLASGVIEVGSSNKRDIHVERNGVIAVITSDEASADLAGEVDAARVRLTDGTD